MSVYEFSEEKLQALRAFLVYDPETGEFTRTDGRNRARRLKDPVATAKTYKQINVNGVIYYAHILAWWFMTGAAVPIDKEIDHKDRNRRNNRGSNLRLRTSSGNKMNFPVRSDNTSGVPGVQWVKNDRVWAAGINVERVSYPLGRYATLEDAARARIAAEIKFFGEPLYPDVARKYIGVE